MNNKFAALTFSLLSFVVCQNHSVINVVDLGYAKYRGIQNDTFTNIITYYGIRYAAPPVGELRWRAPMDIESHGGYDPSEIIDATSRGPVCVQGVPVWRQTIKPHGSEDCLLLDVSMAVATTKVTARIVNQSMSNLIYVSMQYRLASFGFLSSAEIRQNGVGNAGLLDQRSALGWVQRNIRAFGGDPSQVTIIGGSAGGSSVMNQMIMYGGVSSPPFRAAISEYPWWQSYKNDSILETQYRQLLAGSNCDSLSCLRSQTTQTLIKAMQSTFSVGWAKGYYGWGDFYYGPSVDGEAIRDLPSNEFKQGHFTKVPLIVNRDAYEGYNYSPTNDTTEKQMTKDLQTIFPYAKQSFFSRLYEIYPASDFNSTFFRRAQIYGDYIIDCPTYYMATAASDWGMPTWKLIFNAGTQLHGADGPFLWGPESTINNFTLANIMKDWYLGFVINLEPNSVSNSGAPKPYWPPYQSAGASGFTVMDVNYTMMGAIPDMDANPRCDFFHGQSYVVRN